MPLSKAAPYDYRYGYGIRQGVSADQETPLDPPQWYVENSYTMIIAGAFPTKEAAEVWRLARAYSEGNL
jgi:hypothetical protein